MGRPMGRIVLPMRRIELDIGLSMAFFMRRSMGMPHGMCHLPMGKPAGKSHGSFPREVSGPSHVGCLFDISM